MSCPLLCSFYANFFLFFFCFRFIEYDGIWAPIAIITNLKPANKERRKQATNNNFQWELFERNDGQHRAGTWPTQNGTTRNEKKKEEKILFEKQNMIVTDFNRFLLVEDPIINYILWTPLYGFWQFIKLIEHTYNRSHIRKSTKPVHV